MKQLHEIINQEIVDDLFKIYVEVVGPCCWGDRTPSLKDMQEFGEYRAGSRWTNDSKFEILGDKVEFYPNLPWARRPSKEIRKAAKEFDKKVRAYLESKGIEYTPS